MISTIPGIPKHLLSLLTKQLPVLIEYSPYFNWYMVVSWKMNKKVKKQPQRYPTLFTLTLNKNVSQTIGTLSTLSVIFYHVLTTFFPQQERKNFKLSLPLIKWSPIPVFKRKSHSCPLFHLRSLQETIDQFFLPNVEFELKTFLEAKISKGKMSPKWRLIGVISSCEGNIQLMLSFLRLKSKLVRWGGTK